MVGKANLPLRRTRPFTQLVTVPNLLQPDKLVSYPIQKKPNLKSNLKKQSLKSIQELQPNREEIL